MEITPSPRTFTVTMSEEEVRILWIILGGRGQKLTKTASPSTECAMFKSWTSW
jgi:hypothetical protein